MLTVNEVYGPVVQGEGKSAGKEVMFLRLSGCNLACTWCDTPYTWNWKGTKFLHTEKFDKKAETHKMSAQEVYIQLTTKAPTCKSLVISGGEPMLQQKELIPLMIMLKEDNYWIEVETNGTVVPLDQFITLIDQINCSPKLENSGRDNPSKKREIPKALTALSGSSKTSFKFVVSSNQDMPEILRLIKEYAMKEVYLMPEGKTREEQEARQEEVRKISKHYGFKFSPRLHVLEWGNKRAV